MDFNLIFEIVINTIGVIIILGTVYLIGRAIRNKEPLDDFMEFDFEEDEINGKDNTTKRSSKTA